MQFALYTERPAATNSSGDSSGERTTGSSTTGVGDSVGGVTGVAGGAVVEGVEGVGATLPLPVDPLVGAVPSSEHPIPNPTLKMSPQQRTHRKPCRFICTLVSSDLIAGRRISGARSVATKLVGQPGSKQIPAPAMPLKPIHQADVD